MKDENSKKMKSEHELRTPLLGSREGQEYELDDEQMKSVKKRDSTPSHTSSLFQKYQRSKTCQLDNVKLEAIMSYNANTNTNLSKYLPLHNLNINYTMMIKQNEGKKEEYYVGISYKSILLFISTLIFSSIPFGVYRTLCEKIYSEDSTAFKYQLVSDFSVFYWRLQALVIVLVLYGLGGYLYTLFSREESSKANMSLPHGSRRQTIQIITKIKAFQMRQLVTISSLKYSMVNVLSSFLLFYSTNYLSLGQCSLLSNCGVLFSFISKDSFDKKSPSKNLASIILSAVIGFTSFGFSLEIYYYFTYKSSPYIMILFTCLCLISLALSQLITKQMIKAKMDDLAPFELSLSLYINSLLVSTLLLIILEALTFNFSIMHYIGWILNGELMIYVLFGFGICGGLLIFFSVLMSLWLMHEQIKVLKYFEIPLSDILGVYFFSLYKSPFCFIYSLGMAEILIGLFFADFQEMWSMKFNKKIKLKV